MTKRECSSKELGSFGTDQTVSKVNYFELLPFRQSLCNSLWASPGKGIIIQIEDFETRIVNKRTSQGRDARMADKILWHLHFF